MIDTTRDSSSIGWPARRRRLTIAALVTVVLAAGGGVAASSAAASGGSSSGGSSTGGSSTGGSSTAPKRPSGPGAGGRYDIDGLITSTSSSAVTVRDLFGASRRYALTSATVLHSGPGTTSATSMLSIGEHVHVRGEKNSSGLTADNIDIHPAHIDGQVSNVNGNTLTLTDPDGFTRTVQLTSTTTYTKDGAVAGRSVVTVRAVVHAEGTVDSNGTTLDATRLDVRTSNARLARPTAPRDGKAKGGPAGGPAAGGPGRAAPRGGSPSSGASSGSVSGAPSRSASGAPSTAPSASASHGS